MADEDQLGQDRFFRREVVVQARRLDAGLGRDVANCGAVVALRAESLEPRQEDAQPRRVGDNARRQRARVEV
jgi:hypothetical protein